MKKSLSWILAVLLALFLIACDEEEAGASAGQAVNGEAATAAVTAASAVPPQASLLGTLDGNTYQNPRLGLTCTLQEGFVCSTAQELLVINGLDAETDIEQLDAMAANGQPVQVMYALDQAGRRNIMVTFQHAEQELLAQKDLKADLQEQLDGDIRAYEAMGFTNVRGEYTRLPVGDRSLDALVLTGNNQGEEIVSVTVQYKSGDGLVTLTLNGHQRQPLEQLLETMTLD